MENGPRSLKPYKGQRSCFPEKESPGKCCGRHGPMTRMWTRHGQSGRVAALARADSYLRM